MVELRDIGDDGELVRDVAVNHVLNIQSVDEEEWTFVVIVDLG